MRVAELQGPDLDYWVAKADDWFAKNSLELEEMSLALWKETGGTDIFAPSSRWSDGGPIIERERIGVHAQWNCTWCCMYLDEVKDGPQCATSLLTAAMRCYVSRKFGAEVSE